MGAVIVERCSSLSHVALIGVLYDAVIAASASVAVRLCWHAQLEMLKLNAAQNIWSIISGTQKLLRTTFAQSVES